MMSGGERVIRRLAEDVARSGAAGTGIMDGKPAAGRCAGLGGGGAWGLRGSAGAGGVGVLGLQGSAGLHGEAREYPGIADKDLKAT